MVTIFFIFHCSIFIKINTYPSINLTAVKSRLFVFVFSQNFNGCFKTKV